MTSITSIKKMLTTGNFHDRSKHKLQILILHLKQKLAVCQVCALKSLTERLFQKSHSPINPTSCFNLSACHCLSKSYVQWVLFVLLIMFLYQVIVLIYSLEYHTCTTGTCHVHKIFSVNFFQFPMMIERDYLVFILFLIFDTIINFDFPLSVHDKI